MGGFIAPCEAAGVGTALLCPSQGSPQEPRSLQSLGTEPPAATAAAPSRPQPLQQLLPDPWEVSTTVVPLCHFIINHATVLPAAVSGHCSHVLVLRATVAACSGCCQLLPHRARPQSSPNAISTCTRPLPLLVARCAPGPVRGSAALRGRAMPGCAVVWAWGYVPSLSPHQHQAVEM